MTVLVTGGAGYIGTHVLVALLHEGHACVSLDNYSNSSPRSLERVREIAPGALVACEADIRDTEGVLRALHGQVIDSVIHMAGLKAVGESVEFPEKYFDNNVRGTEALLAALGAMASGTKRALPFVFSSSATVYGMAEQMPIAEEAPTGPQNPYGQNKLDIEVLLAKWASGSSRLQPKVANLRYFNPVGAHESGRIGEDPSGIPNNLMPYICQVAAGRRDRLRIFGQDYPTVDGTGVRDYIHVMDLAEGHVAALEAMGPGVQRKDPTLTVNLGTGRGFSVLELVKAFEAANGVAIPHEFTERRPGDVAVCYADASRAARMLGWRATRGIEAMCRDAWRWQSGNPDGYASS